MKKCKVSLCQTEISEGSPQYCPEHNHLNSSYFKPKTRNRINKIIIAKDGWPLEQIIGRPILNFFRRLFFGKYKMCRECWYSGQAQKNVSLSTQQNQKL